MASTNQSPAYQQAEKKFLEAEGLEDKIRFLEEMIRECPKHKSSEKMLANLKTRYKKFKSQLAKNKKSGKGSRVGIKKEDMQAVILGKSNSGKSSLINLLTNAKPIISEIKFSTVTPSIGMMPTSGVQIQIIENPAINSEYYDKGLTNTADTLIFLINNLEDIKDIDKLTSKSKAKKIIVYNIKEEIDKRKLEATLKSKKHNFVIVNIKSEKNIEELKEKLFKSFDNIRVFTKEPHKEKSPKPIILKPDSTIKDVAEKILKGFSQKVKETKIWGPSSKFSGQKVGIKHKLKDLDVVEFKTK